MRRAPAQHTSPLVLRKRVATAQPLTRVQAQRLETLMAECMGLDTRPREPAAPAGAPKLSRA